MDEAELEKVAGSIRNMRSKPTDFLLAMAAKETGSNKREAEVLLEERSRELLQEYVASTKRIAFWTCVAAWAAAVSALASVFLRACD